MRVLLDTHALIWFVLGDPRLSPAARDAITTPANTPTVSAASAWEIATKVRLGKMAPITGLTGGSYARNVRFRLASVSTDDAQLAGEILVPHRDPFDRMLLAQAHRFGALVTNEQPFFATFGPPVTLIW